MSLPVRCCCPFLTLVRPSFLPSTHQPPASAPPPTHSPTIDGSMGPSVPPSHLLTVRPSSTDRPPHPLMRLSNRPTDAPVHFLTRVSPLPQPLPPAASPGLPSPSRVSVHPHSQRPSLSLAGVGSFVPGPSPVALGHFMGIVPKRTLPAAFQILLPQSSKPSVSVSQEPDLEAVSGSSC